MVPLHICSVSRRIHDLLVHSLIPAGYHAIGTEVTLSAITRDSIVDLASADLSHRSHRVKNIIRIIKACSIISRLQQVIGEREVAELVPIVQE